MHCLRWNFCIANDQQCKKSPLINSAFCFLRNVFEPHLYGYCWIFLFFKNCSSIGRVMDKWQHGSIMTRSRLFTINLKSNQRRKTLVIGEFLFYLSLSCQKEREAECGKACQAALLKAQHTKQIYLFVFLTEQGEPGERDSSDPGCGSGQKHPAAVRTPRDPLLHPHRCVSGFRSGFRSDLNFLF